MGPTYNATPRVLEPSAFPVEPGRAIEENYSWNKAGEQGIDQNYGG